MTREADERAEWALSILGQLIADAVVDGAAPTPVMLGAYAGLRDQQRGAQ